MTTVRDVLLLLKSFDPDAEVSFVKSLGVDEPDGAQWWVNDWDGDLHRKLARKADAIGREDA